MTDFRWNNGMLFVILLLQFTAVTGQNLISFTFRARDEVTLPCNNEIQNLDSCAQTTWVFSHSGEPAEEMIKLGRINKNVISKAKSDRLNVTASCSLVIRNVTEEDAGHYTCRQFRSGQQQGPDAQVYLSVVTTTEHQSNNRVILYCSVVTYGRCDYTVKWLYEGHNKDVETSQSACSAMVTFPALPNHSSNSYKLLKCNVTDNNSGKTLLSDVRPQSSYEKTESSSPEKNNPSYDTTKQGWWWWYIIVAVALVTLLAAIIVVAVIRCKRTKGKKTHKVVNMGVILNSAVTPDLSQDTASPEDGVCYASISHIKETNSKAQILRKGEEDEGDSVTYSTVKASSSSSACADLSNLYDAVNRPNK